MLSAPIPDNDKQRLAALRELLILHTPPEERFDRITAFAASEFDMPIALITMVGDSRNWFKSKFGTETCEVDRNVSFCGHAIVQNEVFVIENTTLDPRFSDNPNVIGEPYIHFYAGAPLMMPSGLAMGTLCLMDHRARQFDAISLSILSTLRDLVVQELIEKDSSLSPVPVPIGGMDE